MCLNNFVEVRELWDDPDLLQIPARTIDGERFLLRFSRTCDRCQYFKEVANRYGWRLPTLEELATLIDNDNANPALPAGHPFSGVQSGRHWSASTVSWLTTYAWYADFSNGNRGEWPKTQAYFIRCVRGGNGHDAY